MYCQHRRGPNPFLVQMSESSAGQQGRMEELGSQEETNPGRNCRTREKDPLGHESHSGQTALRKSSLKAMTLIWVIPALQTILGLGCRT